MTIFSQKNTHLFCLTVNHLKERPLCGQNQFFTPKKSEEKKFVALQYSYF